MDEREALRGVPHEALPGLSNEELIMMALGVLMGAVGTDDPVLIRELLSRGRASWQ